MKNLVCIIITNFLITNIAYSQTQTYQNKDYLPPYLKGIPYQGKQLRHGLLKWTDKKPYNPLPSFEASKRGEKIYVNNCLECHGSDGLGNGPTSIKYGLKAGNLKKSASQFSHHYLAFQIGVGNKDMPSWSDVLTEDDVWDLTHYLYDLNKKY